MNIDTTTLRNRFYSDYLLKALCKDPNCKTFGKTEENSINEAIYYYRKYIEEMVKNGLADDNLATAYNNLSVVFYKKHDFFLAMCFAKFALNIKPESVLFNNNLIDAQNKASMKDFKKLYNPTVKKYSDIENYLGTNSIDKTYKVKTVSNVFLMVSYFLILSSIALIIYLLGNMRLADIYIMPAIVFMCITFIVHLVPLYRLYKIDFKKYCKRLLGEFSFAILILTILCIASGVDFNGKNSGNKSFYERAKELGTTEKEYRETYNYFNNQ